MCLFKSIHSLRALFTALFLALCILPSTVQAEEEETLELFSAWQGETSTASRAPKPLSQTAENVTVITAKDIVLINAHTLADILDTVPGIQLQHNGGPGIIAYTYIQSASPFFTQVFVDGISINNSNNHPDVSAVPAQIIERIEIVKGTASSAWGSALGGVINVITKSPEKERPISGSVTASIGERTTADTMAELSGTSGKLGYYFSGGYLGSDGLLPTMELNSKQAYGKLTYDLHNNGQMWGTFSYSQAEMGDLFIPQPPYDFREEHATNRLLASLGLRYTLAEGLDLEVAAKHAFIADNYSYFIISDGSTFPQDHFRDKTIGGSAKLTWRSGQNLLVTGVDYNRQESKWLDVYSVKADRWGIYLNDTLTLGPVSISPGLRLDHTQTNGDQISSSLGATWQINDSTLLRAYTGRGYNVPLLLQTNSPSQKIWTMQVGAESTAIPYLWVKGTLFRNLTWGADSEQHVAKGSELEIRTIPVFHTSLAAGWTYTETTRTSDGSPVRPDRPTQTVKLALRYDDATFRGALIGNHINWNGLTEDNSKNGLIWDLHLGATLLKRQDTSLELFFSGRNLFNGRSYTMDLIPNVGRWFEGGMRVRF